MTPLCSLGTKNWRCSGAYIFDAIHLCSQNTLIDCLDNLIFYSQRSFDLLKEVNFLCQIGLEASAMLVYCIKCSTSNNVWCYLGSKPWLIYCTVQKSTVLWKIKRTDHLPMREAMVPPIIRCQVFTNPNRLGPFDNPL